MTKPLSGYGSRYVGTEAFRQDYLRRATGYVALCEPTESNLLAMALVRNGRVTACSTTTKPPNGNNRRTLATELFTRTRELQLATGLWLTIHTTSPMSQAVAAAGMEPLVDPDDLYQRLVRFGEADSHVITEHSSGLSVTRTGSVHGANYVQLAWGWPAAA